ncbi:uncharacterized protein Dwil_GK10542 [Drosophila willistoni]|uniref:Doublecortin domain-containing protein n=1 Tax=Drosophila willistoni TaxID=7260 RepID=B4NM08_DROWI|nr:uncharacterized protein Dwil_GK10542 [Drosophila willistoni]
MSNEENDYIGGPGAADDDNGAGVDLDEDRGSVAAAAASHEPMLVGQTMPQISSNAQLEGNVTPKTTQFDDNQINNNASNKLLHQSNNNDSNRSSPTKSPTRNISSSFQINYDDEEDLTEDKPALAAGIGPAPEAGATAGRGGVPDYWQQRNGGAGSSCAISPGYLDNMSENSEQPPVVPLVRSKSRPEISSSAASRYSNLSYWKARRVVFYRNGDPFFPGVELRYRPGRDVTSLDNLLDKISPKMDLPRGARYVFSMDGDRKYHLDELEDGAFYVVSSFKAFKGAGCKKESKKMEMKERKERTNEKTRNFHFSANF